MSIGFDCVRFATSLSIHRSVFVSVECCGLTPERISNDENRVSSEVVVENPAKAKAKKKELNANQNALDDMDFVMAVLLVALSAVAFPIVGLVATLFLIFFVATGNTMFKRMAVIIAVVGIATGFVMLVAFVYDRYLKTE